MPTRGKRPRDGTDARRMTHNASEQRRARRINEQIASLRQLMKATGMLGDKSDKGSILEAASTFIERAMAAESTGTAVGGPASAASSSPGGVAVDYARVFQSSGIAQAVAGMDGSFVDCNKKFCELSGFSRDEIRQRSIFNMTPQSDLQRTFEVVSTMMNSGGGSGGVESTKFTKPCKMRGGLTNVAVTMAVIRDAAGNPVNFACAVIPTCSDGAAVEGSIAELIGPASTASASSSSSLSSSAAAGASAQTTMSSRFGMLPVTRPVAVGDSQSSLAQGHYQPPPPQTTWQSAKNPAAQLTATTGRHMAMMSPDASPFSMREPTTTAAAASSLSSKPPSTSLNGFALEHNGPTTIASLPHAGFGRAVTGISAARPSGSLSIGDALSRRSREQRRYREQSELLASRQTSKMLLPAGVDSMGSDARVLEAGTTGSIRAVLRDQGQSSTLASTSRALSSAGASLSGLHMPALHTQAMLRRRGQSADSDLGVGAMDPDDAMGGGGGLSILSAASARGLGHGEDVHQQQQQPPLSMRDQSALSAASYPLPASASQSGLLPLGVGGLSIISDPRNGVRGDLSLISDIPGLEEEEDSQMGVNLTDQT